MQKSALQHKNVGHWCAPQWASAPYLHGLDCPGDPFELPHFKQRILEVEWFWAIPRHLLAEERLQPRLWKLRPGCQICALAGFGALPWQNQRWNTWDTWFPRRCFVSPSNCHVRDHVNMWHAYCLSLPRGARGLILVFFTKAQKQKPYLPLRLTDLYKPWRFDWPDESYQTEIPNLWVWTRKSICKAKAKQFNTKPEVGKTTSEQARKACKMTLWQSCLGKHRQ